MNYRYKLAPYRGPQSRLICPNCGKREFVPYVDTESGEILDESCGRCNRESHCGFHQPPSEFFRQNPGARPQGDAWRQGPSWMQDRDALKVTVSPQPKLASQINTLPPKIVKSTIRVDMVSHLLAYMERTFDPVIAEGLVFEYNLGVTNNLSTIFYQQDCNGRFRGGKIIGYDPKTGHRLKNTKCPVTWVHPIFKRHGYIPADWEMTQVLFGEHLIDKYPDNIICLVEAEKSAVFCAGLMPEYLWVATGGKTQLGDRLNVLRGRRVIAIPDVDAFEAWSSYFQQRLDLDVTVSDFVERYATDADREAQIDIADLFIRWHLKRTEAVPSVPHVPLSAGTERTVPQFTNPVTAEVAKYFSPEVLSDLDALITDLDLVPISIQQLNSN